MQSKVIITPDDLGNTIRVSKNNPEYAHVRVTQEAVTFSMNGWVKNSVRSALIHGKVEDLNAIGIATKKTLPGKIVIKETFNAFSKDDPDRDLKIAGETGIVCCQDGQPIYRKSFYDATGLQQDELIPHNNGEDIREANTLGAVSDEDANEHAVTLDADTLASIASNIEEEDTENVEETTEEVIEEKEEEIDEEVEDVKVEEEVTEEESFEL